MQLRTVYVNGGGLVVGIPPKMARALRIVKGSQVVVSLADRKLTIQRAVITGESQGAPEPMNGGDADD
jgi:antitoxin component of MazEF toxin-antitoxin module